MTDFTLIFGAALLAIFAIFSLFFISIYNSLVRLKHNIDKAWSNIDVLLKQRNNELTKLLDTVKGYMKHEKGVLTKVTEARTAFMNAKTVGEKADAGNMMASTLKSLFAVAENYPQLKADQSFLQFQTRITDIEEAIADRREFYNDSVNTYNIRIEQIPTVFIASMLRYESRELFEISEEDKKDVKISFE